MAFFQWKESFQIGAAEIDLQHRSFMELLNGYYDSTSGSTKDSVGEELLDKLDQYVRMHFRFEESLMRAAGYKELEQQKRQHQYFETLVSELKAGHKKGKPDALKQALPLLRDWFLSHILEEDRKFVPHINPSKVEPPAGAGGFLE
jgi:hemerythrin